MDRGAHFVLTDLQVHSPRDPNWKGSYVTDADREQFAREFIAACRNARLGAVAITDHHDFAFVPYIRRAARSEVGDDGEQISTDDQIVVFPGLELTLAVPCQALLIFSADFPDERLSAVLDKLSIDRASATKRQGRTTITA
jgi:chromosome segregation protein